MRVRAFLFSLCVLLAAACTSPVNQTGSTVPGKCQESVPLLGSQKTDILFIIDNSGSMAEEQAGIAQELPAFISALKQSGGVQQDFHVGVITTSVYQNARIGTVLQYSEYPSQSGRLQPVPTQLPDGGTVLSAERLISGEDPNLLSKFRLLIAQGTTGSGQETPFEAARLAVAGPLASVDVSEGGTVGFLRDGARLLMVVVSDEDDCSEARRPPMVSVGTDASVDDCDVQSANLTPVQDYYDTFQSLVDSTGARRDVIWASISPVAISDKRAELILDNSTNPSTVRNADCSTSFGPGFRHRALAEKFDPQLLNLDSICSASYHDSLVRIAGLAAVNQSLEVSNLPDPRLLKVELERQSGQTDVCTLDNGGIRFEAASGARPALLFFQNQCLRRADDLGIELKLLCAG